MALNCFLPPSEKKQDSRPSLGRPRCREKNIFLAAPFSLLFLFSISLYFLKKPFWLRSKVGGKRGSQIEHESAIGGKGRRGGKTNCHPRREGVTSSHFCSFFPAFISDPNRAREGEKKPFQSSIPLSLPRPPQHLAIRGSVGTLLIKDPAMRKSLPKRHYYPEIWGAKKAFFVEVSGVSFSQE